MAKQTRITIETDPLLTLAGPKFHARVVFPLRRGGGNDASEIWVLS